MNKDILIIIFGRVGQLLYSFLNIKLLTTLLDKEQVGGYYLILSVIALFSMTLISPTGIYFTKNTNKWLKSNIYNPLTIFAYYIIMILFISIPFVILYIQYSELSFNLQVLIVLIVLDVFFGTLLGHLLGTFNMIFKRIKFVIYTNLYFYSGLVLSLVFYNFGFDTAEYWILGLMVSKLIFFIIVLFDFHKYFKQKIDFRDIKSKINKSNFLELKSFLLPLILITFLAWGQTNIYRFFVEDRFGMETLAIIAFGISLVVNLSISFETIINQYILPNFYKVMHDGSKFKRIYYFNKMINFLIPIYFSFYLFILIVSDKLVLLFSNSQYSNASYYIVFGVFIEFFRVIYGLFSQQFYVENNTSKLLVSSIISWLVMIASLVFVVYFLGNSLYIGYSLVFGNLGLLLSVLYYSKKFILFRIRLKYFLLFAITMSGIFLLNNILEFYIDNNILLLLLLGFVYLVVLYFYVRKSEYAKI